MRRKIHGTLILILVIALFLLARKGSSPTVTRIPPADTPVLGKTIRLVEKNFFEPEILSARKLLESASQEMEASLSPLLIQFEGKKMLLRYADQSGEIPLPSPLSFSDLLQSLRQTLGFINLNYKGPLTDQEREYLLARGAVEGLDPHSDFFSPQIYKEFKIGTRGNFGGLGIVVGIREGDLTVIAPIEDTPAWKAGLKAKDRIIQINEEATINMTLSEAVDKLRGPIGSPVNLIAMREGVSRPLRFSMKRALIKIQSVATRLLEGKEIGLIKIKSFQEDTLTSFDEAMIKLKKTGPHLKGIILDLRNNPGGLLDQAIFLADRFMATGTIVSTQGRRIEETDEAHSGDPEEEFPLIVLVNEGSASASEIMAGAFQQNERALVIGQQTYGKGTVQTVYDLKDGSALKLTVAKYLAAGHQEVDEVGIAPNIELLPVVVTREAVNLFKDIKKEKNQPSPRSPFQISYLEATKKDEEEESYSMKLEEDFPIRLAKRILMEKTDELPPLLDKIREEENQRIVKKMAEIGLDWSRGPSSSERKLGVRLYLKDDQNNLVSELQPGHSGKIGVEVTNQGKKPLFQVVAVSRSEDHLFSNLEFPIGKLDPGKKRSWEATFQISELASPRQEPVELIFSDQEEGPIETQKILVKINELPQPLYAYRYQIEELPGSKKNGHPDAGETISLKVQVRNRGPGESPSPVVNLRNLGGSEVFIEKGRTEIPPLAVGAQKEATLTFRVPSSIDGAIPKLSFELSIRDAKRETILTDQLDFSLSPSGEIQPETGVWYLPPVVTLSHFPMTTEKEKYTLKGRIVDDKKLKHFLVFVDEKKRIYQSPSEDQSQTYSFEVAVSLKEGLNIITLIAQDDEELTARKQWYVWRTR